MNTNPESSQQAQNKGETQARRARRQYSEEFKRELIDACGQPAANVSALARSHGIRPNQLRRWLQKARSAQRATHEAPKNARTQTSFVALAVKAQPTLAADIRMNLQSGATQVQIEWPISASSQCAQWLREVLA